MAGTLKAKVKGGLEQGRLFLGMPEYKKRIVKKAGFRPFEGTLNLEVDEAALKRFLGGLKEQKINGFEEKNTVYGSLYLYNVSLLGEKAAIIRPAKTRHPSHIVEVIAPVKFRDKYGLKDNDTVEIGVPG